MKVAVIGSRSIVVSDLGAYLPPECGEIVSGGATGVDRSAAEYAKAHGITLTEFLPLYEKIWTCRSNRSQQTDRGMCRYRSCLLGWLFQGYAFRDSLL